MLKRFLFFLALTFPLSLASGLHSQRTPERITVWNVGQGLWVTWISTETCRHFDIGGEFSPLSAIAALCRDRRNLAHFSHWDWDHIGFAARARKKLRRLCIASSPRGKSSPSKRRYLSQLDDCPSPEKPMAALKELHPLSLIKTDDSANAASRVFMIENRVLLPGDSIASEEKKWGLFVRKHPITLLVLGHHGSRTSTSEALLKNLPHLKQAIASARREVYGHPHKTVLKRLKKNGVAVIATEDWGSLHWELPRPKIIDRKDGTQDSSCERQARSTHCRRKR